MPKMRLKRLLSMVLTLCMVLTMMPAMTMPAYAANGKADSVGFGGKDSLSEQYPLLDKDGVKKSGNLSQLDGEDYVAHLDVNTGTLTLWNYNGGTISNGGAGGVKDITVVLKGDNVITSGSLVDSTGGGDITITTEGTNEGSLTINNKKSTTSTIVGIGTGLSGVNNGPGAITIGGKAKITIDVENTGTGEARGIFARQGVTINGDAELNITAKSTGASGGHSTSGIFTNLGGIVIDTTGKITIDTSGAGEETHSYALYGAPQTTLTKVDTMVLKWTKSGQYGKPIYGTLNYTEANYSIIDESNSKQTITYIKTDLKFTHNSNLDVPGGNGGDAITQIDVNSGVGGGSAPLTFTKISGPPWLNVSSDGKITGTRPTAGQNATTAKIRVTDSRGAWREIEIAVGAVTGNAPVTNVSMGDVVLYSSKPYLVNGEPAENGELGTGGCTAHLDTATGILSLQGYSSGGILITDGSHDKDLIIDLIGDNTITQTGDGDQYGITRQGTLSGNIIVTSSSGGKLTIDVTSETTAAYGINSHNGSGYASGNITISGNANVTIDVKAIKENEFLASAYGINPSDTFSIIDAASLTVTAKSGSAEASSAHGIYTSRDDSEENKVYMNTTGEVSLNTSDNTGTVEKNQPLYAQEGFYLDNVSKLTLKWSGDGDGEPIYPAKDDWNWTASDYRFTPGDKTHTYQAAGNFFTGTIVINGEPRVGETLKASLINTNADPEAIISYRWKVADMEPSDGPTYKVMPADVNQELKISATTKGKAGTIDSDPVIILKGFGPAAPTLSAQAPSALGASDGKIIGTTNKMEYADNEEFKNATDCTASPTLVKAGTYYVRVKETFTHEAGAIATVIVPQGELTKLPTPKADFLATSHNGGTLSGVTTDMKYSVDGGSTWLDITATSIEITNVTTTHGVKVYQPGDNTTTSDSEVQTLTVHQYDKPKNIGKTDCTTEANNDGKLTGLSDGMEYKKNDATSWTEVESTTVITDLTPGTYLVRRMAEDNSLASESVEIVINGYETIEKNIKSVRAIADINVDNGTELASLGLPTTVEVALEDDSTQSLAVSWDNGNPTYAKDTAGDYVFTGTLTLVSGITNTADIKASVKVIVAEVPPEKYSVTYDGNGNTSGDIPKDNKEYSSGQEVTVLNDGNMVKTNYIFDGWNTKADGTGTDYAEGEKFNITENITLYAKWILGITKIEIKTSPTKTEYADQDKLDLTGLVVTVTYADITTKDIGFSDFEKNHLTTSFAHDMPITKTENKTLNVHWDKNNDVFANIEAYKVYYRITFDAQGGTVSPASALTKGNPEGIILGESGLPTPTRDGHTFNGWFSQSTGGDKIEVDTQFNQNTTIYAQWTKDGLPPENYTITVQDDGNGVGSANPTTAVAGTEINLTATANTGYKFKEWQVINGGITVSANKFTMPANAVVIKAIFEKEETIPPVTTYTVTVNGSYASITGAGKYAKDTTVTIYAGSRSNYSFNGWTSPDGISFANANSATTTFTMPDRPITVTANWIYNGDDEGSVTETNPAIFTADGSVKVEYFVSGETASLSINNEKANDIIAKTKNGEVVLNLQTVKNTTTVQIPNNALSSFEKTGLDLVIKLPEGSATIDGKALASILEQSTETTDMKLELKQISTNDLSATQKESLKKEDLVLDINILMGSKNITEFDGKLTIDVPYEGQLPVTVWYLNDKGELEKIESFYKNGLVSFTLNHLSLYVIGEDKVKDETEIKWVNPFVDIKEDNWFYEDVKYVYENDLMIGTSSSTFSPNVITTRGMIVTILHRLEDTPNVKIEQPFTDVAADKWYTNAIIWAANVGIVNGYGNGKFGPEDPITREQLAVVLMNYAKYKGYDVSAKADLTKFEDSNGISNWAKNAMSWANAEGLIQGDGNNLMATGNATRVQVAAILNRFTEKIVK